jgi:hypothetical protein
VAAPVLTRRRLSHLRAVKAKTTGRPLVVGLLSTPSGLGSGARLLLEGLERAGFEPAYLDVTPHLSGPSASIDLAPSRLDDGFGPVLLHINPLEFLHLMAHNRLPDMSDRYRVGVWAWEQSRLPREWIKAAAWVDEFWGSSSFLAHLLDGKGGRPSYHIPYPCALFNPAAAIPAPKAPGLPFRVLTAFSSLSSTERKNPHGAIKAFLAAFPDDPDARLTVQSSTTLSEVERQSLARDNRIDICDAPLPSDDLRSLFTAHDAFLSLHRAEGFGLSIAKALALGVPAVFTDHSGASCFTNSPLSFGVGYSEVHVRPDNPHYRRRYGRWAEPDIGDAVTALRTIRAMKPDERACAVEETVEWWQGAYGVSDFHRRIKMTPFAQRLEG